MKSDKSILKKVSNIILSVILFLLVAIIAVTVIVRVSGGTPNFMGYMVFRVSTGSMEPDLAIGDVILSKSVNDTSDINVGDVITYNGTQGDLDGKLITHQVITAPYEENGSYILVTKGIANEIADPAISQSQVVGKMVTKIPFIGALFTFFLTPGGLICAIALVLLAFAGEFWRLFKTSTKTTTEKVEVNAEMFDEAIKQYNTNA